MKVINSHKRLLKTSETNVVTVFNTLASPEDKVWPNESWPAIRFRNGLFVGSQGGHGRIRYSILELVEGHRIKFQFTQPKGFVGTHQLSIHRISENLTEIVHEIEMNTTSIKATLLWTFAIRWLHDALIEDAFDNVENYFSVQKKTTKYSVWVGFLREAYKRNSFKIKLA